MARKTINLPIDDRTEQLSDEALICRSRGHRWEERAMSRKRFNDLLALGMYEEHNFCDNGCGQTWTVSYDLDGNVIESKRSKLPADYAMPAGTGRLSRAAARVARLARRYQGFAYA